MLYPLLTAIYLALDIGANDAGSAMGVSYGSGAMSMKNCIIIASLVGLIGALTLGFLVVDTMGERIAYMTPNGVLAVGISSALWLAFVLWKRLPISASQSVVGAIIGYAIATNSEMSIGIVNLIILSWIFSPLLAMLISSMIYYFLVNFVRFESVLHKEKTQNNFMKFQIFSAVLISFANGANNVGTSVGFLLPIINDTFMLQMLGGGVTSLGVVLLGPRIIKTVGAGITSLTPAKGFAVQLAAGLVTLAFTFAKMPVSTTHILVGSIIGIGIAMSGDLKIKKTAEIMLSWIFTVPITAAISALIVTLI
ncbi:MAG: anion permease [Candidatus Aenigmatarchaeota archaeon]